MAKKRTVRVVRKKTKKPIFSNVVMSLCVVILMSFVCVNIYYKYDDYADLKVKEQELSSMLEDEKEKQIELNAEKDYYTSDSYIEQTAREKLGLIKSNEKLFVITNE